MMKKLFFKISMLLFVLGMSTNVAWAGGSFDPSSLPPEMIPTLMTPTYCAQLTGHTSSTGGGKVYVNAPQIGESVLDDPRKTEYVEGTSNVAVAGMGASIAGMTKIGINAWAKADPGYWFVGFSYSNMGVDLGTTTDESMPGLYANVYDIGIQENETINYDIYGTFEPIRIAGYAITGETTTADDGAGNMTCDLAVIFTLSGASVDIDASDFKAPAVSGEGWSLTSWDYGTSNAGKITVYVHFSTTSTSVAQYTGGLKLETEAIPAISMNVPLNARTAASSDIEAIRYNKDKTKVGEGDLTVIMNAATPTDVIKLNKDYTSAVIINNKKFTFDLNGYTLSNTLTVNGNSNVTLAYSPYGGSITDAVSVAAGSTMVLNGGTISGTVTNYGVLEQNGATVSGAMDNYGTMTTTDGVHTGALINYKDAILTINGGKFETDGSPVTNNGTALIKKGTITSTGSYAVFTQAKGNTTIEKLAVIKGEYFDLFGVEGGSQTVKCGKFTSPNNFCYGAVTFTSAYFMTNDYELSEVNGKKMWRNTSGAEYREGYKYFAGDVEAAQNEGVSVCHIGGTSYSALEDALSYANNTSEKVVIIMDNDYTLPAGYYTLPSTATLIIPKSNEQGASSAYVDRETGQTTPSLFRKLTLASGVNLDVFGLIEVSGTQFTGGDSHTGAVTGSYGQLQMNEGSHITLQNGSVLRAWGYITGDIANKDEQYNVPMGEIDARRGAIVYELFQMGDWGNTVINAIGLVTGDTRFPVNSYFVQNIEAPVKYHPGSKLFAQTSVTAGGAITMCANEVQMIGVSLQDVAVFLMDAEADAENTWVRKWYDASKDQQVYEINSGAHIGSLVINLASSPLFEGMENYIGQIMGMPAIGDMVQNAGAEFHKDIVMNSGQYVLPITYNFKLHLLSGTLDFTQNTELIPGSELVIDKGAKVYVTDRLLQDVLEGSLYIWDAQDWNKAPTKVEYSPVFEGEPLTRDIDNVESAKVNVRGTFDTQDGYIFTSESGGNIFSSIEDAGTFMFTTEAKAADYSEAVKVTTSDSDTKNCYSAYLRNSDKWVASNDNDENYRYVHTGGTEAGQSYCYLDIDDRGGRWTKLEQRECFTYDDGSKTYYIKPQEYVAVSVNAEWDDDKKEFISLSGNDDHTFSDAAGAGRLFINLEGISLSECQWWEVEAKNNYFHCIHPENDTYYEWVNGEWKEVEFTITWNDWDGSTITTYTVPYGTQAEWLSTNPKRNATIDYTYDFTGWSPALGKVTSDVTYTATYEAKQIKYTITFVNEGGMEIERHLLARNEMPVCENVPTRTGYILEWSPALAAVTGNQTYTATWLPEPPTEYQVTFYDYNGTTVLQQGNVAVGEVPTAPVPLTEGEHAGEFLLSEGYSTKPATSEYTYVFDHWSPALEEVSATSAKTYTAVYREVAKTYTIRFYQEDGSTQIGETQSLTYGAMPVAPAPTKQDPQTGYTYTYVWQNKADASKALETVKEDASYKAVFTGTPNKYTVTVKSNPSGACSSTGAGLYDYNTSATLTLSANSGYTFTGWSDGYDDDDDPETTPPTSRTITVTENKELVANFTVDDPDVIITWKNEAGTANLVDPVGQKANTATIFPGATPTKAETEAKTYTFYGWSTAANGGGTIYKNGLTPKATEDETYYAYFNETARTFDVVWKNEAGTVNLELDYDQPYGAAIAYNSATPTKQATAAATYTFDGWSTTPNSEGDVITPATVTDDATYYAHFATTPKTYTITFIRDDGSLIDKQEVAYSETPTHADPTKPATAQYSYTFTEWDRDFESVTGLATYTAIFNGTLRTYTVTWLDGDGNTIETDENVEYGATPSYDGATPTKSETAEYTYEFNGNWSPSVASVTGDATYIAQFDENPKPNDLEIGVEDSENLNDEVTERTNLIITSNGVSSGQLLGAANLEVSGEAIFKLQPAGGYDAATWYAVAVPWTVDPNTGIYAGSSLLSSGSDIYIIEFDGEAYANNGGTDDTNLYWHFLHQTGADMVPGKLYMIYLASAANTLDFHKKAGEALLTTNLSVSTATSSIDPKYSNWNAIANPALYTADLGTGVAKYQTYDNNDGQTYTVVDATTENLIVAKPIFVQAETSSIIDATIHSGSNPAPAYRRAPQAENDAKYVVEISSNGKMADRIIVETTDEKENKYVIGQDLAKFGISSKVAQMWVNRYDAKLCANTIAWNGERAEYPLNISAPAAGEYTLNAEQKSGDADLYLTYNGEAIWNLSDGAYVLNLNKGTDINYGLRVSARVPQVVTGVDEAIVDAQGDVRKVLINNQVFIIRGEKVYTIDGQIVK